MELDGIARAGSACQRLDLKERNAVKVETGTSGRLLFDIQLNRGASVFTRGWKLWIKRAIVRYHRYHIVRGQWGEEIGHVTRGATRVSILVSFNRKKKKHWTRNYYEMTLYNVMYFVLEFQRKIFFIVRKTMENRSHCMYENKLALYRATTHAVDLTEHRRKLEVRWSQN